jgi:hypothetical protein
MSVNTEYLCSSVVRRWLVHLVEFWHGALPICGMLVDTLDGAGSLFW